MNYAATAVIFDTLQYAKKLEEVGFTREQAEVQTEMIADFIEDKLATKRDLKELEVALKRDIEEMRIDLKRDIKELGYKLTITMGTMIAASVGVIAMLFKIL